MDGKSLPVCGVSFQEVDVQRDLRIGVRLRELRGEKSDGGF